MADKEKVVNGSPNSYLVDLSHKTLGKFDAKGEFRTSDPDTIKRIEVLEANQASLKKKPLGKQLAEKAQAAQYKEYRKIAEIMCDVFVERGLFKGVK